MDTTFFIVWGVMLAFNGLLMHGLGWAAEKSRLAKYRIRTPKGYQIPPLRKWLNITGNGLFSLCIFGSFFYFLGDTYLYKGLPTPAGFVGETLGVLLLYDFMYYFLHRIMHHRLVLQYVHRTHHLVRFPTAPESIFLHPAENFAGLGLLLLAMMILGPVSATSFLIVFFVHAVINVLVHSNLEIPHPAFRLFNFWTTKHDIHHNRMNYNYASIFPFWDQAFGTDK